MKIVLGIMSVLFLSSAYANEIFFGDLNYFLNKSLFDLGADVNYVTEQKRTVNDVTKTQGYVASTRLAYAFSDRFNAQIGLNYNYLLGTFSQTTGANFYYQDGLQNPSASLNYRALRQQDSMFNLDFGFVSRFKIQDESKGSADPTLGGMKDGNAATGRNSYEFNARLGRKWNEANEFYLRGGVLFNQSGKYRQLVTGGSDYTVNVDSSVDTVFGAFYQYRPVHEFMMSIGFQGTSLGEVDTKGNGVSSTYHSHIVGDTIYNAKYLITENFLARFNYSQGYRPDYNIVRSSGGDQRVQRGRAFFIGFGLDYLF